MTDLTNKTVDELREIVYDQLPQGYPQPSKEEEALAILARRAQANDAMRATLSNWCVQFGAALCPTAGSADSFGDGMRAAKEQVSRILAAAPTAASSGAPAPADSQREAAIEAWRLAMNVAIGYASNAQHPKDARDRILRDRLDEAVSLMRSAPPAPVAPVTDAVPPDLAAALAWWGGGTEPKTMAEAVEKARSYRNDAHELTDVAFELRNQPEGNPAEQVRRLLAPVTDAEVEAAIAELFGFAFIEGAKPGKTFAMEHAKGTVDKLRTLIARRVAEARGAGLLELRARLLSTAASLPNRQMGHSDEDFDRGYVESCENWAQEIDRLLAAPLASKLAEEPAQEPKTDLSWRSEFADLKRVTHAEWLRHDKLIVAIHGQVECVARRIEALENNKEAGK